jgi:hypothetical protein
MNEINYSFHFGKEFNIFFLLKKNYIILKKKSRFFFLKIPSIYFYKKKEKINSFLFNSYFTFISFIKHLLQLHNKLYSFYYLRLKLKGLGYRIIHLSQFLVKIFFNRSNYFYLHIPKTILFKYKIRRLFFLSTKIMDLSNLVINLLLLKKYIIYRLSGLFYPRQIILLKPGKNKFR